MRKNASLILCWLYFKKYINSTNNLIFETIAMLDIREMNLATYTNDAGNSLRNY